MLFYWTHYSYVEQTDVHRLHTLYLDRVGVSKLQYTITHLDPIDMPEYPFTKSKFRFSAAIS